jgi:hypothetical protein
MRTMGPARQAALVFALCLALPLAQTLTLTGASTAAPTVAADGGISQQPAANGELVGQIGGVSYAVAVSGNRATDAGTDVKSPMVIS